MAFWKFYQTLGSDAELKKESIALFFITSRVHSGSGQYFWINFLILSILKNHLAQIKVLGPNLHVSAIQSTIEGCAGPSYHNHQNFCLCLSTMG